MQGVDDARRACDSNRANIDVRRVSILSTAPRLKPLPDSFCQTLGSFSNARTRLKPSLTTFPFLGMKTVGKSCMGAGTVSLP
jgi:hypothetical protein